MLVTIPNVVALTQASAQATITTASLVVGTVTTATNNTVPAGSVISQNPTGGSNVPAGSAVNLVVSSGPAPVTVCDVDRNGVINQNDINAIFAARGRTATGPNDPRDANKDGLITTTDSRLCVLQCTKPQCAP
jgi:beta-lactam-binding protein with PASTA domain